MRAILLALFLAAVLGVSGAASAVSYTVTVQTDSPSYVGSAAVLVTGQVSPAPGPSTAVFVRVFGPSGALATAAQAEVNGTTGAYSLSFVAGGSSAWIDGNYLVNATWGAYGPLVFATTTFSWSSTATTTSTTTTSSTTTTQTSSTSTATSLTTSHTTTSTTSTTTSSSTTHSSSSASLSSTTTTSSTSASSAHSGGIPVFPLQGVAAVAFVFVMAASYLLVRSRRATRAPGSLRSPV